MSTDRSRQYKQTQRRNHKSKSSNIANELIRNIFEESSDEDSSDDEPIINRHKYKNSKKEPSPLNIIPKYSSSKQTQQTPTAKKIVPLKRRNNTNYLINTSLNIQPCKKRKM